MDRVWPFDEAAQTVFGSFARSMWREQVAYRKPVPLDWLDDELHPGTPARNQIVEKRHDIWTLQRAAGQDERLQLQAMEVVTKKLSRFARDYTGRSQQSAWISHYEEFCGSCGVPMFPTSDAMFALWKTMGQSRTKALWSTRQRVLETYRALGRDVDRLFASNEAYSQLCHFEGISEAIFEWVHKQLSKEVVASSSSSSTPGPSDLPNADNNLDSTQGETQSRREEDPPSAETPSRESNPPQALGASVTPLGNDHGTVATERHALEGHVAKKARIESETGASPALTAVETMHPRGASQVAASPPPPTRTNDRVPTLPPNIGSSSSAVARRDPDDTPLPRPELRHAEAAPPFRKISVESEAQARHAAPLLFVEAYVERALESQNRRGPLARDSLEDFFRGISPSIKHLAKPLRDAGLNTYEDLLNFVSFDGMLNRVKLVTVATARARAKGDSVAVTADDLAVLEGAVKALHDSLVG